MATMDRPKMVEEMIKRVVRINNTLRDLRARKGGHF
jgi:hypothetical protein